MTCSRVEKVYCLEAGRRMCFHIIRASEGKWVVTPTLKGEVWGHRHGGILATFATRSEAWLSLIPSKRGHLCTAITFPNGKVVYI